MGPAWEPLLGELEKREGALPLLSKILRAVVKEESQAFHKRKPPLSNWQPVLASALRLTIFLAQLHLESPREQEQEDVTGTFA